MAKSHPLTNSKCFKTDQFCAALVSLQIYVRQHNKLGEFLNYKSTIIFRIAWLFERNIASCH